MKRRSSVKHVKGNFKKATAAAENQKDIRSYHSEETAG